jgi:hypothetical protein
MSDTSHSESSQSKTPGPNEDRSGNSPIPPGSKADPPLPGVIAIALYMLVLAAVISFGVVGNHLPKLLLIVAPLFVAASFGLLRMLRWAWALTLSAVFLLMTYNFWLFLTQRQAPGAVQGVLNLVFFFYLVRVDVRSRLRS